jgi:hypothetical protein
MNRRSFLAGVGLTVGGVSAGLVGRPIVDDLAATDEPIIGVSVNQSSSVSVVLAENHQLASVFIVGADTIGAVASWFRFPHEDYLLSDPLESGEYRALARRGGTAAESHIVQEVTFEV